MLRHDTGNHGYYVTAEALTESAHAAIAGPLRFMDNEMARKADCRVMSIVISSIDIICDIEYNTTSSISGNGGGYGDPADSD